MPYNQPQNDNLSIALEDIVPDVVAWNIRYFHDKDKKRVDTICAVLGELNADIFVLEEILEGSLQIVIDNLHSAGAGNYKVAYGTTGGDQRVAIMYDLDWIRAKETVAELFAKGQISRHLISSLSAFISSPREAKSHLLPSNARRQRSL
jgi:endonuclease/exonuclease/phosphatase family metal-dependent hydrolase